MKEIKLVKKLIRAKQIKHHGPTQCTAAWAANGTGGSLLEFPY